MIRPTDSNAHTRETYLLWQAPRTVLGVRRVRGRDQRVRKPQPTCIGDVRPEAFDPSYSANSILDACPVLSGLRAGRLCLACFDLLVSNGPERQDRTRGEASDTQTQFVVWAQYREQWLSMPISSLAFLDEAAPKLDELSSSSYCVTTNGMKSSV